MMFSYVLWFGEGGHTPKLITFEFCNKYIAVNNLLDRLDTQTDSVEDVVQVLAHRAWTKLGKIRSELQTTL